MYYQISCKLVKHVAFNHLKLKGFFGNDKTKITCNKRYNMTINTVKRFRPIKLI